MPDGLVAGLDRERSARQGTGDRIQIVRLVNHGGQVDVIWGDGYNSRFHAVWLRDNCVRPAWRDPANGQRRFPLDFTVVEAAAGSDSAVKAQHLSRR